MAWAAGNPCQSLRRHNLAAVPGDGKGARTPLLLRCRVRQHGAIRGFLHPAWDRHHPTVRLRSLQACLARRWLMALCNTIKCLSACLLTLGEASTQSARRHCAAFLPCWHAARRSATGANGLCHRIQLHLARTGRPPLRAQPRADEAEARRPLYNVSQNEMRNLYCTPYRLSALGSPTAAARRSAAAAAPRRHRTTNGSACGCGYPRRCAAAAPAAAAAAAAAGGGSSAHRGRHTSGHPGCASGARGAR